MKGLPDRHCARAREAEGSQPEPRAREMCVSPEKQALKGPKARTGWEQGISDLHFLLDRMDIALTF